jgi:AcrR family transcriptional regulator
MQAARMLPQGGRAVNPPGRTQAERSAQTRAALIGAARELFAERGYAGAPREEIVERAGVTRGALYHHFASKEDLFLAVFEQVETELTEQVALAAFGGTDARDALRLGARAFLDAAATPEVRRIVLLDAPSVLSTEVRRELSERHGLGLVREALRAAAAEGVLAITPVEPLAHLLLAALHEAATVVAETSDTTARAAMHEVVEQLLDTLFVPEP